MHDEWVRQGHVLKLRDETRRWERRSWYRGSAGAGGDFNDDPLFVIDELPSPRKTAARGQRNHIAIFLKEACI